LVTILAADLVSRSDALAVDARIDGGPFIPVPLVDGRRVLTAPVESALIEVRATDEAGNVASTTAALVRGRADSTVESSGCGCNAPGTTRVAAPFSLAVALIAIARRRRTITSA